MTNGQAEDDMRIDIRICKCPPLVYLFWVNKGKDVIILIFETLCPPFENKVFVKAVVPTL